MEDVWMRKVTHGGRQVLEHVEDQKLQLDEAAAQMSGNKDWDGIFDIVRVSKEADERATEVMNSMEELMESLGL